MALFPVHNYFCFNGEIKPVEEFVASENEGGIYEVLRVLSGVPLFLEDHLARFSQSAEIAGKAIRFSDDEISSFLTRLIADNKVNEGNILISCKTNLKAFFIPHVYPSLQQYADGVKCGVLHAERKNPNAKVFQTTVRKKANKLIAENDLYEVLLIDHEGKVTEGSRSNVFFIKGNVLITPVAKKVLLGITRQKTIECADKCGYRVEETEVLLNDLTDFDAMFITGTSPKILPVKQVENTVFDCDNRVLRELIECFDKIIADYIKRSRKD